MHAVFLCHFCTFSPSIDREPLKSFYIFLPSIVSPYSSNPLQSCTWTRTLKSLYLFRAPMQSHYVQKAKYSLYVLCALCGLAMLRPPMQSSFTLQPLKVSTHHARPYIVFIWFAYLCSPYTIKSERVSAYLLPPLQSPNTLRTYAVSFCSSTSRVSTMSHNPMQSP